MNIEEYKEIRESNDINKIKRNLSQIIINDIIDNDIELNELSDTLGISVEKLSKIILEIKKSTGSELVLVSKAIDKKLDKIK